MVVVLRKILRNQFPFCVRDFLGDCGEGFIQGKCGGRAEHRDGLCIVFDNNFVAGAYVFQ